MSIDDLLAGVDSYNQAIVRCARSHGVPVVEEITSRSPRTPNISSIASTSATEDVPAGGSDVTLFGKESFDSRGP